MGNEIQLVSEERTTSWKTNQAIKKTTKLSLYLLTSTQY